MDDEVVIPDEGRKRRLPSWMIGVASADQVRNAKEENGNAVNNVKEGNAPQILLPNSKRIRKGTSLPSEVNSCLLVKCERKKRGMKLIQQEDESGSGDEAPETAAHKKRCNRGGRKDRKLPREKIEVADVLERESSEEIETRAQGGDDEELTMDDLMSIAQEYITTDKHMEQPQSLHREREVESGLPVVSISGKESGGLPTAPQTNMRSPTHEEMRSVHNSIGTSAGGGPIRTGDPAQDMLNLFLGPLLKKPAWEENKIGLIKEDMTFACDMERQGQNMINTKEVVPLTKKKSSLKDKVAMFLD